MTIFELLLTALSLGTDAFTISICKGLTNNSGKIKDALIVGFYFGLFQFIMPIIGYYLGNIFTEKIIYYNPYISMILLITIGFLMIKENQNDTLDDQLNFKQMLILSIATSIDALVIGISFSFLNVNIITSSIIIGIITFIMCFLGYLLGNLISNRVNKYANFIAGIVLIFLGIKIFIQNLLK